MPIFARRRIQAMIRELSPHLDDQKSSDIVARLNSKKKVEQVLPAEMELCLLWALAKLGNLDIEPFWWANDSRPDAYSEHLIQGMNCVIEIAAINDNGLSGEKAMDEIAMQVMNCANSARRGLGNYLRFEFGESSGFEQDGYRRWRLAPDKYVIDDEQRSSIRTWITSSSYQNGPLILRGRGLAVVVRKAIYKQTRYHNIHSSMPTESYSLEDNPIYKLLDRKRLQLRAAPQNTLKLVFLADVGSALLRNIGQYGDGGQVGLHVSGSQIIRNFVYQHSNSIDAVVVFVPRLPRPFRGKRVLFWDTSVFGGSITSDFKSTIKKFAESLPLPQVEGYQARSMFRQGMFLHERGMYLDMIVSRKSTGERSIKISARLFLDLLAGRISEKDFRHYIDDDESGKNQFQRYLEMGLTISKVEMVPRIIDEDDDHLELHFSQDAAATVFQAKKID